MFGHKSVRILKLSKRREKSGKNQAQNGTFYWEIPKGVCFAVVFVSPH